MSEEKYTFLLVGKTGVGKSAFGNSILTEDKFKSTDSCISVTAEAKLENTRRSGFDITVVDTPGFLDTKEDEHTAKSKACDDMKKAMSICPTDGTLAVILVIKYGDRYSIENMTSLYILETIFGKENLWKSCVIVMTYGENFDLQYRNKKCFKEYVFEEGGTLGKLFKMSNYKVALFHNLTKDLKTKQEDFKILMKFVKDLDQGYTQTEFKNAKREQNRLKLESELPKLKEEFEIIIVQITHEINILELDRESLEKVENLEGIVNNHLARVNDMDSSEKIYYRNGEERFLEDLRISLGKLINMIIQKKKRVQEMKIAQELITQIEKIILDVNAIGQNVKGIYRSSKLFQEKLTDVSLNITKMSLSKDLFDKIQLTLCKAKNELRILILKCEQENESAINTQIQDIIQSLNGIQFDNRDSSDTVIQLKECLKKIKLRINEEDCLVSSHFIENIYAVITNVESDIDVKSNILQQYRKKDDLEKEINVIYQRLKKTPPSEKDIYTVLSTFKVSLNQILFKINTENLKKDLTDSLKLSLNNAKEILKSLEEKVQEKKEVELKLKINAIMKRLDEVCSNDKNASKILKEIQVDKNKFQAILEEEKLKVRHCFLESIYISLSKFQNDIETKEKKIIESIKTQKLQIKINEVKRKILLTNFENENILRIILHLEKEIESVKANVIQADLKQELTAGLFLNIHETEKELKKLRNKANKKIETKLFLELRNIDMTLSGMLYNSANVNETLSKINERIHLLKCMFEQDKKLMDDVSIDSITFSLKQVEATFNTIRTDRNLKEKEKLENSISEVKWKIQATDVKGANSYNTMCQFQNDLNNISKAVEKTPGADSLKKSIIDVEKLLVDQKNYILHLKWTDFSKTLIISMQCLLDNLSFCDEN